MTVKTKCVDISLVSLPEMVVTKTPNSVINYLGKTIKNGIIPDPAIIVLKDSQFVLVDRIDVYEAALKNNLKKLNVVVIPTNTSPLITHLLHTVRGVVNPIKKVNALQNQSMHETVRELLQMDKYYVKLMSMSIPEKTEKILEALIDELIAVGITVPPTLKFLRTLLDHSIEEQKKILKILGDTSTSFSVDTFSWPDKATLLYMLYPENRIRQAVGHKLPHSTPFKCPGCDKDFNYTSKGVEVLVDKGDYQLSEVLGEKSITLKPGDIQNLIEDPSKEMNIHVLNVDDISKLSMDKKIPVIILFDNHRI